MKIIKHFLAAVSLYTKIPAPHFKLKDGDGDNAIMFLPLMGALIGAADFLLLKVLAKLPVNVNFRAAIAVGIPLIITGGFHVDGFMDTIDAIKSYRSKEEKLEILKDPHVGAFAVISFATALIFMICGTGLVMHLETVGKTPLFILLCGSFVISRAMAALTSLVMKKAKDEGMLYQETQDKGTGVAVFVMVQLIAVAAFMAYINPLYTGVILLAYAVFTVFYVLMTKKNFGGVTGDTAGYYVTMGEVFAACVLAGSALALIG